MSLVAKRADKVIFIETMGTNVESANPPGEKLVRLFHAPVDNGLKEYIIEIDYKFSNYEEAGRIMGGFFGDSMKDDIIQRKLEIIKEYTGIWIYN